MEPLLCSTEVGLQEGAESGHRDTNIAPINEEEKFCIILKRGKSNHQYQCRGCDKIFVGGAQKIRVHITGIPEGNTSCAACMNPDPIALELFKNIREKAFGYKRLHMAAKQQVALLNSLNPHVSPKRVRRLPKNVRNSADKAVLSFFAACDLAPTEVFARPEFVTLVKSVCLAGPDFEMPEPLAYNSYLANEIK